MASPRHPGGHLDATADRAVVFCHACSHEWFLDTHGLTCPACESDITEIVSIENDPRAPDYPRSLSSSPRLRPRHYDDDSDPEEADIEEYTGPHGFIHRRSTRHGPERQDHHDPGVEPVMHRFYEMIQNFGHPRVMNDREPMGQAPGPGQNEGEAHPMPRFQRTTFTSGPFGGTASVTIFSGPVSSRLAPGNPLGHPQEGPQADPFQAIFSNVLRDFGPPQGEHQGAPPPNFARGLQEILGLLNPANAAAGDAVYSQEALDRIITQLMEANPQSNAAPPATEEALQSLDRKAVTQDMLQGEEKTECTICIDDINVGDQVVFLPCKHWFHEGCVTLWLKEHNTCPICRTPIEQGNNRAENQGYTESTPRSGGPRLAPIQRPPSSPGAHGDGQGSSRSFRAGFGRGLGSFAGSFGRHEREPSDPSAEASGRPFLGPRPVRLEEAFRASSTIREEQQRQRERGGPHAGYDTSRLQRRTSISPSSPRETLREEYGARMRQRSPSESSRRGQGDRDSGRSSGQGPLGWLRERFGGGGGSHQGSPREERRF